MPREGWLKRQMDAVSEDIKTWPIWMRKTSGLWTEADEYAWEYRKKLVLLVEAGAKECRDSQFSKDVLELVAILKREISTMERNKHDDAAEG